jgi:hypothetical protein
MASENTKRIVVIKDIPSNIIEEAILILKGDPKEKSEKNSKDIVGNKKKRENDFLLKEAEIIINNYIKDSSLSVDSGAKPKTNKGSFTKRFKDNAVINIALFGIIGLLIFLISRMI